MGVSGALGALKLPKEFDGGKAVCLGGVSFGGGNCSSHDENEFKLRKSFGFKVSG
jgi:hypothetical protein